MRRLIPLIATVLLMGLASIGAFAQGGGSCGNGTVDGALGESCDPPGVPAGGNGNFCRADCTVCGDTILDAGEECDDGNGVNEDACRNNCTLPTCGDSIVNTDGQVCPASPPIDLDAAYATLRGLSGQDSLPAELQPFFDALAVRSQRILARADGPRIRSLHGLPLGNVALTDPLDPAGAHTAALQFLEANADLFRLTTAQRNGLATAFPAVGTRVGDGVRIRLDQYHSGLLVEDGGVALRFLPNGQLHSMWGTPHSALDLPTDVTAQLSQGTAETVAVQQVAPLLVGTPYATGLVPRAELVIEAEPGRLLWLVGVTHPDAIGVDYAVRIDAVSGAVLVVDSNVDEGTVVKKIPVRYFVHLRGQKDDTTFADNPHTSLTSINVNVEEFLNGTLCLVRLHRLGAGRSRVWSGRQVTGNFNDPHFVFSSTLIDCDDVESASYFKQRPDSSFLFNVVDTRDQFNEQQIYVWAQKLKTQVDKWGRAPGGEFFHYPVEDGKDENFEIVVNAPAAAEQAWCGGGVQHGCIKNNCGSACASWFALETFTPHIVFFFNDPSNSSSPQFIGQELSSSYSIVAHEVGHTISWQYGRPRSESVKARRSRSEGWSMALPAIWGKNRWTGSLEYDESSDVTTGGEANTGNQWMHHTAGNAERFDTQDCENADPYRLAWPWVQAMWELANNLNAETGQPVWSSSSNAVANTADFLMAAMYDLADSTSATWREVAWANVTHQMARLALGKEKGVTAASQNRTISIFAHHGLLQKCQ